MHNTTIYFVSMSVDFVINTINNPLKMNLNHSQSISYFATSESKVNDCLKGKIAPKPEHGGNF